MAGRHWTGAVATGRWSRAGHSPVWRVREFDWLGPLARSGGGSSRGTILIVEDDAFGRETLGHILEADGYRVAIADDGGGALEYLHQHADTGLILLDLMLPNMDGWGLLRRLSDEPLWADIPVIVVSAAMHEGDELPVTAWFQKPVAVDVLRDAVRRHLSS